MGPKRYASSDLEQFALEESDSNLGERRMGQMEAPWLDGWKTLDQFITLYRVCAQAVREKDTWCKFYCFSCFGVEMLNGLLRLFTIAAWIRFVASYWAGYVRHLWLEGFARANVYRFETVERIISFIMKRRLDSQSGWEYSVLGIESSSFSFLALPSILHLKHLHRC